MKEVTRQLHVRSLVEKDPERQGVTMLDIYESLEGMTHCLDNMALENSDHWRRGLVTYSRRLARQATLMGKRAHGLRTAVQGELRKT